MNFIKKIWHKKGKLGKGLLVLETLIIITISPFAFQILIGKIERLEYKTKQADAFQVDSLNNMFLSYEMYAGVNAEVTVLRKNQEVFRKKYGEFDLGKRHLIGSTSKQFAAVGILLLAEKGLVQLNDSICLYLRCQHSDYKKITIKDLLQHTSGIDRRESFWQTITQILSDRTLENQVELILSKELLSDPGEKYLYSNLGFTLVAKIIENISQKKYSVFLQDEIFKPLNMNSSGHNGELDGNDYQEYFSSKDFFSNRISYRKLPKANYSSLYGAGGLFSTTEDLKKWMVMLASKKLLKPNSKKQLFKPYLEDYALGFVVEKASKRGDKVIWHNGKVGSFYTLLAYYPERELSLIIRVNNLNNSEDMTNFRKALEKLILEKEYRLPKAFSWI